MSEIAKNRLFAGFIVFYIITAAALPNSGVAWSQNQTPLPKLMEDLKNPSAHVRVNALYAIGNMGPEAKDAVPALIEAMHSSDTLRPRQIMSVLIKIGPNAKAAIPALKAKMNSDDSQLRIAAAGTMLAIDPTKRELYPVLTAALENKNDHQIADTARSVLYQIGQESEATVHSLIRALKIESSGTRRQAAKLLKPMVRRTDIVEPAFIQVLDDDDLHVRLTAVTALKENVFSSKAVVPALVRSLDDSALEVRRAAVTALKFAPFAALIPEAEHAVPALIRALTDDTPEVRRTAVSILQRMGPNAKAAVPALIELLDDDNIKLRVHAAIALVYIDAKTHAALPVLLEGLGSSWMEFRIESIIRAIGRMGPDAKEATVGLLYYTDDGYYNRSSEVKKALDQIGPAAVPYLIESLDNEGFATPLPRRTAVEYLAKYGPDICGLAGPDCHLSESAIQRLCSASDRQCRHITSRCKS